MVDKKSETLGSIPKGSTLDKINVDLILNAVATILQSQIMEDQASSKIIAPGSDVFFFSEEKYILEKPDAFDKVRIALLRESPSVENIFEFMKALYECAQFSPECCIISLVYINRMIAFTEMPLQPTNWRPLALCSLLVAQKVWDDRYLSNADFAFIYPFFVTEEINKLEQKFLELIQYNVTVKSNLYAKYYFELRGLFKDNEKEFPLQQINRQDAELLEQRSREYKDIFEGEGQKAKKKANSTFGQLTTKNIWD
ncbi:n-terminal domain-containing protein [Stylonychia lemnae]|uniref:N-terminal domain-containing protein n=1 Tax=Stylonychia lemnae TaxID=5949 RepID=A0A078AD82_STYLE|nr:n-terminal domain-containing protein [Stylonychia lemnae]|eukprot:CDW78823.1 n-terminal domain-containing protein [Stylonychia lemnae]